MSVFRDCGVCENCVKKVNLIESSEEDVDVTHLKCLDPQEFRKKAAEERREEIHHPRHYGGDTTYEAIKVIEAWSLGFCLGNAVKYICRAETKGMKLLDLKKARWYLDREIQRLDRTDKGVDR